MPIFTTSQTGATHDIDLPAGLLDQVKAVLPPNLSAASVEIIFRGKASPRPEPAIPPYQPMSSLEIKNLHVSTGDKEIVKGVTLTINTGEIHAVMGPNGTGKSTLAKAIAGHPDYAITEGDVLVDGKSILEMETDERARAGIFLAFQYPSSNMILTK